ncbi:acyl carrier protein [Buchnera aphidicola]|uniref:acyl carrier protein n=1 Tax=Buchnera aphidicola TaxID=9 RepID=UPI0034643BD8
MQNIKQKIKKIISKIIETKDKKITSKTHLIHDLKIDSLDIIEMIMAIEEKFNIEIPDEEIENFQTIQSIIEYIQKHTK